MAGAAAGGAAILSALAISQGNKEIVKQANASIQSTLESYKFQTLQMVDNMQSQVSSARLSMVDTNMQLDRSQASLTNRIASMDISGNLTARLQRAGQMQSKLVTDNMKSQLEDLLYSTNRELENLRFSAKTQMMQTAVGAKYSTTTGWKAVAGIAQGAASGAMIAG